MWHVINGRVGEDIYIKTSTLAHMSGSVNHKLTLDKDGWMSETGLKRRSECAFHHINAPPCPRVDLDTRVEKSCVHSTVLTSRLTVLDLPRSS